MGAPFAGIALVAVILAAALFVRARQRVNRGQIRRGRILSMSEISPGAPLANQLVASHSAYQRYVIEIGAEKVTADSYFPHDAGDDVDLLVDGGRYIFKFDAFIPALSLAAVAALAAVIVVILYGANRI